MKIIKSLTNCYNKLSNFGKILVFIALLLVVVIFFRSFETTKEGMMSKSSFDVDSEKGNFLFKQGNAVYDDFYADIYDYLVFNRIKNDYEVGIIVNSSNPTSRPTSFLISVCNLFLMFRAMPKAENKRITLKSTN